MKLKKKRWLGLAFAPALFALIGFASPASAANYSGNCAGVSAFDGNGNVDITNTGTCTLPTAITASGFIHINSTGAITAQGALQGTDLDIKTTGGAITTQALTSTNGDLKVSSATNITTTGAVSSKFSIQANATAGKIAISGNLASNQSGAGGNILLVATGNVSTGSISTNSGGGTAGVEIHANTNAAGGIFTIGAATANGVNTTIDTSNASAGGQDPNFVVGGIFITNGNVGSTTAQIKVTNASNINVAASASRSGLIYFDARKGTITLPTGALSSSGPAGQPAGQIILMADTLKTVNNTVITASQTATSLATNHGVIVAASNITVAGAGGLKIRGDGNGITGASQTAYAIVLPTGGISVSSSAFTSNNVNTMLWTPSSITSTLNAPVTVSGAGAFTLTADGNYARAAVYAYPITFSNAAVNITSKGTTNHLVELVYSGTFAGSNGLTLSGTGAVTLDASGSAGNDSGGTINVFVDQATINSSVPSLTIKADGKGTGNGGTVGFRPTKVVTMAAPTVNVSANGASGSVTFNPATSTAWGDASITSTTFNLNADGPTSATGNAGTIFFAAANSTFGASTKMKFSAVGPTSGSGNGGNITVFPGNVAGGTFKLGTNVGNLQVLANAGSTGGDGGTINVNPFPGSISIETANAVSAAASTGATANSKGGSVTLIGNPNVTLVSTVTGAVINVDGKGTSDGGTIKILGNGTLNLGSSAGSLSLSAKAAGTGNGGTIEVGYTTNLTISGTLSVAGGTGNGSNGKGGSINIHDIFILNAAGATFTADGKGTGFPGTIKLAQTGGSTNMNLSSAQMSASGDPVGDASGHDIDISTPSGINMDGTILKANASDSGNAFGGSVHITSAAQIDLSQPNTLITAKGADNGPGGVVVISSPSEFLVNTTIKVDSGAQVINPNTFGGSITLNSVTCQRRILGNTWPKFYWNCVNPASPQVGDDLIATTAAGLTTGQKTILENIKATLYVQLDSGSFASYFGHVIGSTAGFSFPEGPGETFNVTVFQKAQLPATGYSTLTTKQFTETAVHELGHGYDYGTGSPVGTAVKSNSQAYINAINADLAYLNSAGGGSPCLANGNGPFNGVTDFTTNAPFCNGAVLNNPKHIYDGLTFNADIAAASTPTLGPGNLLGSQGSEIFAQVFSYHQYAKNPPVNYFITTADGLFQKGYFQCTQALVAASIGATFTPVLNYTCP